MKKDLLKNNFPGVVQISRIYAQQECLAARCGPYPKD